MNIDVESKLGPCGINCEKCFAFKHGDIRKYSGKLKESLGNFEVYAKRFTELLEEPCFANYPDFDEMLDHFSSGECEGCRKAVCKLFKSCNVRECYKLKGVSFCFECAEFPCNKTGFDEHLKQRWIKINNRMKRIGAEAYYKETQEGSRYV